MFTGPLGRLEGEKCLAAGEPVVEVARGGADLVVLGRADEGRATNCLGPFRHIFSGQSQVVDRRLAPMHEQATSQRPALRDVGFGSSERCSRTVNLGDVAVWLCGARLRGLSPAPQAHRRHDRLRASQTEPAAPRGPFIPPRTAACGLAFRRRSRLPAANAAPAITPAPGAAHPAPAVAPAAPPSDVDKVAAKIADHAFRERNNLHRRGACGPHRGKNEPCQHDRDRGFRHCSVLPFGCEGTIPARPMPSIGPMREALSDVKNGTPLQPSTGAVHNCDAASPSTTWRLEHCH